MVALGPARGLAVGSGYGRGKRRSQPARGRAGGRQARVAWAALAGPGAYPLALLGVGHAPPLQHQLEVLGGRVAARGQPLEAADGGQLRQRPELLPQHVLQHLGLRGTQEGGRRVHGGLQARRPPGLSSPAPGAARGPRGREGREERGGRPPGASRTGSLSPEVRPGISFTRAV